ncbi:MAG: SDR family oxidoreductase [Planctomycetes bacterium]|nr:SDR family oxidoreductase [Planctomycetota bacterium]NUQ33913.1 SDR family oxidoreductase [Planctomycetaceae bacterium]
MNGAIIITGASAGFGAATAIRIARLGYPLVLTARRENELQMVGEKVRSVGGQVTCIAGDITDVATRQRVVDAAKAFGRIHALLNNAGFGQPGPVALVGEAEYRRQMEVNVYAPVEMIRLVAPIMRYQGAGRVVNVSSAAGRMTVPMMGWYCASKHALESLTEALRSEVRAFGIHVSLIEPGPVATEFASAATKAADTVGGDREAYKEHIEAFTATYTGDDPLRGRAHPDATVGVIVHALTARCPRFIYRTTALGKFALVAGWLLPRSWYERVIARVYGMPGRAKKS